ncbi:MAG: flagellar biosynthesis repressor FlbT [Novosphingobium sp.]|nr:flagellar biosynthesis repressor FlbT [Novosphingobium sp.]
MTGLILKLAPSERVLINGAVIENGDRRAKLSIRTPNANILRLKDAIHPDKASTPVARVCYICQLILTGEVDAKEGHQQLLLGIEQLSQVFYDRDSRAILTGATNHTISKSYYHALKQLRELLPREARLFAAKQP